MAARFPQNTEVLTEGNQLLSGDTKELLNSKNTVQSDTEAILRGLDGQYFLVDVCSNLTNKKFSRDVDSVIQRAKDAGIKKIIVPATNLQNGKEALRLTRIYPGYVYCTAGIHPHDAKLWTESTGFALREMLSNPECVAIGQCGLDFSKTFSDPVDQKIVFGKQVELACELQKPLIIYERDAHQDLVSILNIYNGKLPTTVLRSFTGNCEHVKEYLSLGLYIGLTGYIWKDKSNEGVRKILEEKLIPLDRLLVETDSPFMYPNTRANQIPLNIKQCLTEKSLSFLHRYCTFQRNEPCSLPVSIEMIAAYFNVKPEDVALKTTFSALKIFGLN